MLARVQVICFAASYAIALLLELSRLVFHSRIRGAVRLGFVAAGWFAHSAYLYYRAIHAHGSPLSSYHDWYLLAAWVLVLVYFYLSSYHPHTHFGAFLLPLVLALIAVGALAADRAPIAAEPASKIWDAIHAASILLATVSVLVGFAAGVMYLGKMRRLKLKLSPFRGFQLPSLEWLQRTNSRALVVSLVMVGISIFSGVILNRINAGRHGPVLSWHDPLVLGTLVLFLWLLLHAVIAAVYRPIRRGRKVAYLTVVSFIFLVLVLAIGLFAKTQHAGLRGVRSDGKKARLVMACGNSPSVSDDPSCGAAA
jgi:ABC-type transport system involved in cytochrome c biogenesis permease subunit